MRLPAPDSRSRSKRIEERSTRNPAIGGVTGKFWIIVPYHKLCETQRLCQLYRISASFGYWWIQERRIRFRWS